MQSDMTKRWEIAGIIATLLIVLSIPLYLLRTNLAARQATGFEMDRDASHFVGREKCISCHKAEYDKWKGSHHDLAMDTATPETVLGNFNNVVFEHRGIRSRFYRKDERFFVYTEGPDGRMGHFEIQYTFGAYPLQQYLVPFPGGRLQCLSIAWDVKKKKWYHLYPDRHIPPGDWLHWTRGGQNWNGMCAECHSTGLEKRYDPEADTFDTTWSEIDVSCEACHGPASMHVAWAKMPDMARPDVDNYALTVKTAGIGARKLVELCAPCHSRRASLSDYTHTEDDLLDSMLPSLLTPELYFADGQILDEVYVYGSFTQSKMYHRDVRCSDCHDVHSAKIVLEGNALCLQCHRAGEYDTRAHHFHKHSGEKGEPIRSEDGEILFEVGTGAQCVTCHMPGRLYMGIDYRPDHSLRIPRPDLSQQIHAPNACNRCHEDKTPAWADEAITKWYGPGRRQHYGRILQAGRAFSTDARQGLIQLAADHLYPVIVRATALDLLKAYPGKDTRRVMTLALSDDEALIRRTALTNISLSDVKAMAEQIAPLLYDPVKAVRHEAARRLAENPSEQLNTAQVKVFNAALEAYEASMRYSGDFAFGRHNLGNLYVAQNRMDKAIASYQMAIDIDGLFYPAKVNLAMLYNQQGKNDEAERLLREVVDAYPDMHDVAYSLGLLLAERAHYEAAAQYLGQAAAAMPQRARIHYNLGLLFQILKKNASAEAALLKAVELEPENLDFLYAAADHYIKRGMIARARQMAELMITRHPENEMGHRLKRSLKDLR